MKRKLNLRENFGSLDIQKQQSVQRVALDVKKVEAELGVGEWFSHHAGAIYDCVTRMHLLKERYNQLANKIKQTRNSWEKECSISEKKKRKEEFKETKEYLKELLNKVDKDISWKFLELDAESHIQLVGESPINRVGIHPLDIGT